MRKSVLKEREEASSVVVGVCGSESVSPASISPSSVEDSYSFRIDYPYHPDRGIWSW